MCFCDRHPLCDALDPQQRNQRPPCTENNRVTKRAFVAGGGGGHALRLSLLAEPFSSALLYAVIFLTLVPGHLAPKQEGGP